MSSKKLKLDETSEKETSKDLEVIVESGPVDFGPDDKEGINNKQGHTILSGNSSLKA